MVGQEALSGGRGGCNRDAGAGGSVDEDCLQRLGGAGEEEAGVVGLEGWRVGRAAPLTLNLRGVRGTIKIFPVGGSTGRLE